MAQWRNALEILPPTNKDTAISTDIQLFKLFIHFHPQFLKKLLLQTNQEQMFNALKEMSMPDHLKEIIRSAAPDRLNLLCAAIIKMVDAANNSVVNPLLERLWQVLIEARLIEELETAILRRDIQTIKTLLRDHPQLVAVKDGFNMTALHFAARNGFFLAAITLIKHGASLDDKGPWGLPARHYAYIHSPHFLNLLETAATVIENTKIGNNPHLLLKNPYQNFAKLQERDPSSEPPAKRFKIG